MKLLLISSKFNPGNDGLSDYTTQFADNISSEIEKLVVLSNKDALAKKNHYEVFSIGGNWRIWNLFSSFIKINQKIDIDTILIEYVPYMYGRAGINISFPIFFLILRFLNRDLKINIMFHELWYPCFSHEPKSWIIHPCHKFSVWVLGHISNKIFCSTENFVKELSDFIPLKKNDLFHLAVPSNITGPSKPKTNNNYPKKIVHFGTLHSSKSSLELFQNIIHNIPTDEIHLNFIGLNEYEVKEFFPEKIYNYLHKVSTFHGKLSSDDVIRVFEQSDYMMSYYIDGATTRRGTLMAALKYGLMPITNLSSTTDSVLKEAPIIYTNNSIEEFVKSLKSELKNEKFNYKKEALIKYYNENFSWEKCIKLFINEVYKY